MLLYALYLALRCLAFVIHALLAALHALHARLLSLCARLLAPLPLLSLLLEAALHPRNTLAILWHAPAAPALHVFYSPSATLEAQRTALALACWIAGEQRGSVLLLLPDASPAPVEAAPALKPSSSKAAQLEARKEAPPTLSVADVYAAWARARKERARADDEAAASLTLGSVVDATRRLGGWLRGEVRTPARAQEGYQTIGAQAAGRRRFSFPWTRAIGKERGRGAVIPLSMSLSSADSRAHIKSTIASYSKSHALPFHTLFLLPSSAPSTLEALQECAQAVEMQELLLPLLQTHGRTALLMPTSATPTAGGSVANAAWQSAFAETQHAQICFTEPLTATRSFRALLTAALFPAPLAPIAKEGAKASAAPPVPSLTMQVALARVLARPAQSVRTVLGLGARIAQLPGGAALLRGTAPR